MSYKNCLIIGGTTSEGATLTSVEKFNATKEIIQESPWFTLDLGTIRSPGMPSYNYKGYVSNAPYSTRKDFYRCDAVTETSTLLLSNAQPRRLGPVQIGNSSFNYIIGGDVSSIERFARATETLSNTGKSLDRQRYETVSLSSRDFGFILGGRVNSNGYISYNIMSEMMNFSTEVLTRHLPSSLPSYRSRAGSLNHDIQGVIFGGIRPGVAYLGSIDILNYSTRITSATSYSLSVPRQNSVGFGVVLGQPYFYYRNVVWVYQRIGYVFGGNGAGGALNQIEKILYPTYSGQILSSSSLGYARTNASAVEYQNVPIPLTISESPSLYYSFGYLFGGINESYSFTSVLAYNFFIDSWGWADMSLDPFRYGMSGLSYNRTKGYLCGGTNSGYDWKDSSKITSWTYSTGVAENKSATLQLGRTFAYGLSDYNTKGYIIGGEREVSGGVYDAGYTDAGYIWAENLSEFVTYNVEADLLTYSTEVAQACVTADLTFNRARGACLSMRGIKGFILGGMGIYEENIIPMSTVTKINYVTDVASGVMSGGTSEISNKTDMTSLSFGLNRGYFLGGYSISGEDPDYEHTITSDTYAFEYSTEIQRLVNNAALLSPKRFASGISDHYVKGWIVGGMVGFYTEENPIEYVRDMSILNYSRETMVSSAYELVYGCAHDTSIDVL